MQKRKKKSYMELQKTSKYTYQGKIDEFDCDHEIGSGFTSRIYLASIFNEDTLDY
jgi:hypothetical protein